IRAKTPVVNLEPTHNRPESGEASKSPAPTPTLQSHRKIGRVLVTILYAISIWCALGIALGFFVIITGGELSENGPRNLVVFVIVCAVTMIVATWANKSLKLPPQSN